MLLMQNSDIKVSGTNYAVMYAITQSGEKEDPSGVVEYGISCKLFEEEQLIDSEKVHCITSERDRIEKILRIIKKHQVFPAHIRDVIEDLLILEFEEKQCELFR